MSTSRCSRHRVKEKIKNKSGGRAPRSKWLDEMKSRSGRSGRPQSSKSRPGSFLALAHHQLSNHAECRAWLAKAVPTKDAPWEDAMIDRFLRREVEAEMKRQ